MNVFQNSENVWVKVNIFEISQNFGKTTALYVTKNIGEKLYNFEHLKTGGVIYITVSTLFSLFVTSSSFSESVCAQLHFQQKHHFETSNVMSGDVWSSWNVLLQLETTTPVHKPVLKKNI